MNWESKSVMAFFLADLRKSKSEGRASLWDLYQAFNCQFDELRRQRIEKNMAFAQRSEERLKFLEQAEREGVLVVKE